MWILWPENSWGMELVPGGGHEKKNLDRDGDFVLGEFWSDRM